MRLAIIPARGGSKRIKNKNIIDFLGKPLISYALDAVKKSGLFDVIHVSTDSLEIRGVVENLGYDIQFMRNKELSDDYTGLLPVIKWVNGEFQKRGQIFEEIFCVMPTAPLLTSDDLTDGHKLFTRFNGKYPLMVVTPFSVPVEWAFHRGKNTVLIPKSKESLILRSQDLRPTFYESGPFNIFGAGHLKDDLFHENAKYISLLLKKAKAIDIDDMEDLELAKILYLGGRELEKSKGPK
jgi:CMP-N-acetylneuraminic acid synthetase